MNSMTRIFTGELASDTPRRNLPARFHFQPRLVTTLAAAAGHRRDARARALAARARARKGGAGGAPPVACEGRAGHAVVRRSQRRGRRVAAGGGARALRSAPRRVDRQPDTPRRRGLPRRDAARHGRRRALCAREPRLGRGERGPLAPAGSEDARRTRWRSPASRSCPDGVSSSFRTRSRTAGSGRT